MWEPQVEALAASRTVYVVDLEDALRDSAANMFVHKELATTELVAATTQPTLVVWGDQDTIMPPAQAARFAKLIPDAEAHMVDDCGHALTLDCPDETTALMKAFLS